MIEEILEILELMATTGQATAPNKAYIVKKINKLKMQISNMKQPPQPRYIKSQICPLCKGSGTVESGKVHIGTDTCTLCSGAGRIVHFMP